MEARLSSRFWTVGAGERLATVMWNFPSEGQDAAEDARWPVWREFGGRWGSWRVRRRAELSDQCGTEPSNRGGIRPARIIDVDHRVLAGVNHSQRREEHARPGADESPGPPGSSPVQRAGRKEPREPAVQPCLAPVIRAVEPQEVLQCERPRSQPSGDILGEAVGYLR